MIRRLLDRLLYRQPRGGEIRYAPSAGVPIRLTRGTAAIPRAAWDEYGEEFFAALLPDTDFLVID